MKQVFASLLFLLVILFNVADVNAKPNSTLPDGSALTDENLENYKASDTFQNLTIREGAKMSKTMNFDDCHNAKYRICAKFWGPCEIGIKVGPIKLTIPIPSFGIGFKYWEPNAIVETVCSQSKSYYSSNMNLSSRLVGKKRILGEGAKIAGIPAEKCVETVRRGGGMEGAGAMPRYFNETHIWGVGILPRFFSAANPIEATVSSICGFAGLVGGLYGSFSGAQGDAGILSGDAESFTSIPALDSVASEGSWMTDAFDTYTNVSEGFEGMTGLDLTDTLKTAATIGMGAMATMKKKAPKEVRPEKLCKEKEILEEAKNKNDEINDITQNGMHETDPETGEPTGKRMPFDLKMFQDNYDDGGVCPIGLSGGYTLKYDSKSFRGVQAVPVDPNYTGNVRRRVSQVQIAGLYPACDGYGLKGTSVNVFEVLSKGGVPIGYSQNANKESYVSYTDYDGDDTISTRSIPYYSTRYNRKVSVKRGDVKCVSVTTSYNSNEDGPSEYDTQCSTDASKIYTEANDHRKKLNKYLAKSVKEPFEESSVATDESLAAVNKRIADLGGDCDSNGKAVGTWGDAVIGAAVGVASMKGLEAGLTYVKESEAYAKLKEKASEYADVAIEKVKSAFVDKAKSAATDAAKDAATDAAMDSINADSILSDSFSEYMPGLDSMDVDFGEAMDYAKTAMDIAKMATYDGALRQAAIGIASSYDPTGLWPGFTSEMSALSWRGKNIPLAQKIQGMIGLVGQLPCAIGSIGTDIGLGSMGNGAMLAATEDWLSCVGTWGPLEPKTGFVYHRDSKVAAALAGYRGYKLAVSLKTIKDHNVAGSGEPMKINLDFPHKSECFVPGTAIPTWESKAGISPVNKVNGGYEVNTNFFSDLVSKTKDYAMAPISPFIPTEESGYTAPDADAGDDTDSGAYGDADSDDTVGSELTKETKQLNTESEGTIFTYWRKTNCCLYVVGYYGYGYRVCFEVDRKY